MKKNKFFMLVFFVQYILVFSYADEHSAQQKQLKPYNDNINYSAMISSNNWINHHDIVKIRNIIDIIDSTEGKEIKIPFNDVTGFGESVEGELYFKNINIDTKEKNIKEEQYYELVTMSYIETAGDVDTNVLLKFYFIDKWREFPLFISYKWSNNWRSGGNEQYYFESEIYDRHDFYKENNNVLWAVIEKVGPKVTEEGIWLPEDVVITNFYSKLVSKDVNNIKDIEIPYIQNIIKKNGWGFFRSLLLGSYNKGK